MKYYAPASLTAFDASLRNKDYLKANTIEKITGAFQGSQNTYREAKGDMVYEGARMVRDAGIYLGGGIGGGLAGSALPVAGNMIGAGVGIAGAAATTRAIRGSEETGNAFEYLDEPGEQASVAVEGILGGLTAPVGGLMKALPTAARIAGVAGAEAAANAGVEVISNKLQKGTSSEQELTAGQVGMSALMGGAFGGGFEAAPLLKGVKFGKQKVNPDVAPTLGTAPVGQSPLNPGNNTTGTGALPESNIKLPKATLRKEALSEFMPDPSVKPTRADYFKDITTYSDGTAMDPDLHMTKNFQYEEHLKQYNKQYLKKALDDTTVPPSQDPLEVPRLITKEESDLIVKSAITPRDEALAGLPTETIVKAKQQLDAEYQYAKTNRDMEYETEGLRLKRDLDSADIEQKPKVQRQVEEWESRRSAHDVGTKEASSGLNKKIEPLENELNYRQAEQITQRVDKTSSQNAFFNENPINASVEKLRGLGDSSRTVTLKNLTNTFGGKETVNGSQIHNIKKLLDPVDNLGKLSRAEYDGVAKPITSAKDPIDAANKMSKTLAMLKAKANFLKDSPADYDAAIVDLLKTDAVYKNLINDYGGSVTVNGNMDVPTGGGQTAKLKDMLVSTYGDVLDVRVQFGDQVSVSLKNFNPNAPKQVDINRIGYALAQIEASNMAQIHDLAMGGKITSEEAGRYHDLSESNGDIKEFKDLTRELIGFDNDTQTLGNRGYKGDVSGCA